MGEGLGALRAAALATQLPPGSRTMRAVFPESAWTVEQVLLSNIEFWLHSIAYGLGDEKGREPEPIITGGYDTKKTKAYDIERLKKLLAAPREKEGNDVN